MSPELASILERIKAMPPMTKEERDAQRESWVRAMTLVVEPCLERIAAYEASKHNLEPHLRWPGDGPVPRRWIVGNTIVYRTMEDAVDD